MTSSLDVDTKNPISDLRKENFLKRLSEFLERLDPETMPFDQAKSYFSPVVEELNRYAQKLSQVPNCQLSAIKSQKSQTLLTAVEDGTTVQDVVNMGDKLAVDAVIAQPRQKVQFYLKVAVTRILCATVIGGIFYCLSEWFRNGVHARTNTQAKIRNVSNFFRECGGESSTECEINDTNRLDAIPTTSESRADIR